MTKREKRLKKCFFGFGSVFQFFVHTLLAYVHNGRLKKFTMQNKIKWMLKLTGTGSVPKLVFPLFFFNFVNIVPLNLLSAIINFLLIYGVDLPLFMHKITLNRICFRKRIFLCFFCDYGLDKVGQFFFHQLQQIFFVKHFSVWYKWVFS